MNKTEIIIVCVVVAFVALLCLMIFFRGLKLKKADEASNEKKETEKKDDIIAKPETSVKEEKPLPVGIIREEVKNEDNENDLAPFRESAPKETKTNNVKPENKNIAEQIKELSPEMKAILMSDVIKPKF